MSPRGVLLDIEGTTSSIRFVYEQMFPFARQHMAAYLTARAGDASLWQLCRQVVLEAGRDPAEWNRAEAEPRHLVLAAVSQLMDQDAKTTGLKQLQGLVWERGFRSGELRGHVYDDVEPFLKTCRERGIDVRIYSSGSVAAQQLFFGYSLAGNLLPWLAGHYDTSIGPKTDSQSYRAIARDFGCGAAEITFASDNPRELDAAREAGLVTVLCIRPENPPPPDHSHPTCTSLLQLL